MRAAGWGAFVAFAAGCQHASPGPEQALSAYRQALGDGDVETVRALSSAPIRERWDTETLRRWAAKNPRLLLEAKGRLSSSKLKEEARLETEDGSFVRLVKEADGWKVAEGGLLTPRFDTPEAALQTFFFAATGHLGLLRKCIPDQEAQRFSSDFALGKHLHAMQGRIFAARDEIGPISPGMARIDGSRATIAYGSGKAAELVLQGTRWRVLDVE